MAAGNQNANGRNARPHPGPLPRGEGESFAGFLKCRAMELERASSSNQKAGGGLLCVSWLVRDGGVVVCVEAGKVSQGLTLIEASPGVQAPGDGRGR